MRRLTFKNGTAKGAIFDLNGRQVTVGRADENLVVIEDGDVSRHHAVMIRQGDEYRVHDLGSINGTRINDEPVSEGMLKPGDTVEFGLVQASYDAPPPGTQPPAAETPAPAATIVRQSETREQLDDLNRLNHELNQQLLTARKELFRAQEVKLEAGPEEIRRLQSELAASREDVERARESLQRVQELARRNDELTAQLGAKDREIETVRQEADERLKHELEQVNVELVAARGELDRLRHEQEQRIAQELEERRQLQAQLAQAEGDRDRLGRELEQTRDRLVAVRDELDNVRGELEQVKSGSVDLDQLVRDRSRLENELEALRQKAEQDREQISADHRVELEQLRAELSEARSEIEVQAKKETALIMVQPVEDGGEIQRLRGELEQARTDLEAAQEFARRMEALAGDNEALATQLTETQRQIAALREDLPAENVREVERLKDELAVARAEFDQLDAAAPPPAEAVPVTPVPLPGGPPQVLPPGVSPRGDELPGGLAGLPEPEPGRLQKVVVGALILVGVAVMFWHGWSPEEEGGIETTPPPQPQPVVENRVILDEFDVEQDEQRDREQTPETEPPVSAREPSAAELAVADAKKAMRELEQELARSPGTTPGGKTLPAVDDPAAGLVAPPAAAPADESGQPVGLQSRAYADPAGRFRCELPPHWRMWEQRTPSESRLRLVSDRDEIFVVVRAEDRPVLQPDDQLLVEAELVREYQLRHLGAMTDKETTRWRMVGAGRGLQVDLKTRENGRDGWTRLIEHRLHGRSCLFELNVSNLAQRAVLELIFESFLLNFEVLPPPGPTE